MLILAISEVSTWHLDTQTQVFFDEGSVFLPGLRRQLRLQRDHLLHAPLSTNEHGSFGNRDNLVGFGYGRQDDLSNEICGSVESGFLPQELHSKILWLRHGVLIWQTCDFCFGFR